MRREARTARGFRLVDLEHDGLVAPHARKIEPAMVGVVGQPVGLADAVRVAAFGHHQVARRDAARIGQCQRIRFEHRLDRPPHLDDREAPRQQGRRLVRQPVAHPLRARPFGVVVVRRADHFTQAQALAFGLVAGTHGVVEHHHAHGARVLLHQIDDLGVVAGLDLLGIKKIGDRRVVRDQFEPGPIEREFIGMCAAVENAHRPALVSAGIEAVDATGAEGFVD